MSDPSSDFPAVRLTAHSYGKSRVRVLKVMRDGPTHSVKELEISIALTGAFESSYRAGDNSSVIPTDTMKNTVNVLASKDLGPETEPFLEKLASHFLGTYPQVENAAVRSTERVWSRMVVQGSAHPHSFMQGQAASPFAAIKADRSSICCESGITDLLILKSTGSGFEGFPRCPLTTLPEAKDRILATSLSATWQWLSKPGSYRDANAAITATLLATFSANYSPSVQTSLFQMGEAALRVCPEIRSIRLSMPNKHYLPIDLKPFGLSNNNELFLPTDEPYGLIEAELERE